MGSWLGMVTLEPDLVPVEPHALAKSPAPQIEELIRNSRRFNMVGS
ncbi:MAG: hypothetical protein ACJAZ8_001566 [Planctomycetota bacterium]|jgi:hypothetical protein